MSKNYLPNSLRLVYQQSESLGSHVVAFIGRAVLTNSAIPYEG